MKHALVGRKESAKYQQRFCHSINAIIEPSTTPVKLQFY